GQGCTAADPLRIRCAHAPALVEEQTGRVAHERQVQRARIRARHRLRGNRPHPGVRVEAVSASLKGLLGRALAASHAGRLRHFITDESSPAVALFDPRRAATNERGDWYGEHAGKWLYAAAKAAHRTGDAELLANVRRVAGYLVSVQEPDGYLGTYAPDRRFMRKQPPSQR